MWASSLLGILEESGRKVWTEGDLLKIAPASGLQEMDWNRLRDLKPELMLLSSFSAAQRAGIMRLYPDADLVDLQDCRDALDAWARFTAQEQAILASQPWRVSDIGRIGRLKAACQGEVVKPGTTKVSP